MWEPLEGLVFDDSLAYVKPKPQSLPEPKPEPKPEPVEEENEFFEWAEEQRHERRVELATKQMEEYHKVQG